MIGFWSPCKIFVFDIVFVDTDVESYDGRHPNKILSQHKWHKKGKYI